jgi:hypothetical protein
LVQTVEEQPIRWLVIFTDDPRLHRVAERHDGETVASYASLVAVSSSIVLMR